MAEWEDAASPPYWRVITRWEIDGNPFMRSADAVEFVKAEQ
jgi:hypothetical protein